MKENIHAYAFKLLKKKNYFIREFYLKLLNKYDVCEVNKVIKDFIMMELLNDKYLSEMKICYLLHIKMYGRKYIENYFTHKGISYNLIKYHLSKYKEDIYLKNIDKIKEELIKKSKSEEYIYNYLLRKGYTEDEIKRYVS